jgi:hypothetical protein
VTFERWFEKRCTEAVQDAPLDVLYGTTRSGGQQGLEGSGVQGFPRPSSVYSALPRLYFEGDI